VNKSGIIITRETYKAARPSDANYIWFLEMFGNDSKVNYDSLLYYAPPKYKSWIRQHFYMEPDVSPNYTGNLKIGQMVYFERNGIGDYRKAQIHRICENESHCGHYVLVDDIFKNINPITYKRYPTHDVFHTLHDLKYAWHTQIDNIT